MNRWTIDIKLTKWSNLGIYSPKVESTWEFLVNLRRAGLYPNYYAAQARREGDAS